MFLPVNYRAKKQEHKHYKPNTQHDANTHYEPPPTWAIKGNVLDKLAIFWPVTAW